MKLFIISTILVCLVGLYPDLAKESDNKQYEADIVMEKIENGTTVTGVFVNNSSEEVGFVYRLSMHKNGGNGRSTSNQGGFFKAEPGEKVSLSRIKINLEDGDSYSIDLKIYYGQELVAEKFISSSFEI